MDQNKIIINLKSTGSYKVLREHKKPVYYHQKDRSEKLKDGNERVYQTVLKKFSPKNSAIVLFVVVPYWDYHWQFLEIFFS